VQRIFAKLIATIPAASEGFAMLPLTDIDGSLKEISYALDTLKLDGIGLLTNYHDKMARRSAFLPVMETQPAQGRRLHPSGDGRLLRQPGADPTAGDGRMGHGYDPHHRRHRLFRQRAEIPRHRWIFSHSRGTMPFLVERFVRHPLLERGQRPPCPRDASRAHALLLRHRTDSNKARDVGVVGDHPPSQIVFAPIFPIPQTGIDHVKGLGPPACSPRPKSWISSAAMR